jgi:small conductance mechanosensitive channel
MPSMLDIADMPAWVEPTLRVLLIAVVAVVAIVVLRKAVFVSVRGFIERKALQAGSGSMPPVELERRVNTIARLAVRVGGGIILAIAGLMALGALGVDIGPAIAGLGVVGIAVGFGAQSLVRDWLAGIFVVLENQYSEGDHVRIAGVDGVVEDFGLRRTTLRDAEGTVHFVPNGAIVVSSNLTRPVRHGSPATVASTEPADGDRSNEPDAATAMVVADAAADEGAETTRKG